ncbi:GNAT family N-acetyltransferase [Geomicrobium sp. JCM 19039]|uniref:GNAT family N-acetyltransferase n=1 Tax=Geomicrobium sp. JCM 19039 TaxID=1460636 RepID=UPI00045F2AAC|nr:GNAT family N-acetyltransferase [Geomicrobium sp. JCM 19039]GAK10482.1 GCN5-related N-acetyltransferase [Geomicrobium sp. JCM 19039]
MKIRKAAQGDQHRLTEIAISSKTYWGYSEEFMSLCKDELKVSRTDIQSKLVYLLEDREIKGFYCLSIEDKRLESLFVHPQFIGQGIGKLLWVDLLQKAKAYQLNRFQLESDPFAESFYVRMGAIKVGSVHSEVFPGRKLPVMEYIV